MGLKNFLVGLFKSKSEPVRKFEKQKLNIGVTDVKLTLLDGREFVMKLYGHYSENPYYWVGKKLVNSKEVAQSYLKEGVEFNYDGRFVDDMKDPKVTVVGKVIKKELGKTKDYFEEYNVGVKE